jgi:hypothetical protein
MPWFYFHLRSPAGLERDDIGLECAGIKAAYLEACRSVPGIIAELGYGNINPLRYGFEITDAGGGLLMEVPFTEVLDRGRKPVVPPSATLFREGRAEIARTATLISSNREERAALRVTLTETMRILALSRQVGRARP